MNFEDDYPLNGVCEDPQHQVCFTTKQFKEYKKTTRDVGKIIEALRRASELDINDDRILHRECYNYIMKELNLEDEE